ncbi:MAG: hypothetical protein AB1601_15515 [Planctomycetota bacterium]
MGEVPPTATLLGGPLILLGVAGWLVVTWRRDRSLNATVAP